MRERKRAAAGRAPACDAEDATRLARVSLSVAAWTAVSRVTGFARVAMTAAVLGPTYLGNVFQATNNIPNYTYALLTGGLFSNLLVPPLVRHIDARDSAAAERLAGAFVTATVLLFGVVAVVVLAGGPLIMGLLSAGVRDPMSAAAQRSAGLLLLALVLPQLLLYAVAGTGEAVMNAHGRFALAAAAPVLENVGLLVTMSLVAWRYGTGDTGATAPAGELRLLGVGATVAVALHAGAQWWGARRVGVRLLPRAPWREREVAEILRRGAGSFGYSALDIAERFGVVVVANRLPGGVVAFELARNFYSLPTALGARPVTVALLPRLSRISGVEAIPLFRRQLVRGAALIIFLTTPAAVAYAVLARPLAAAVSFGQMATSTGRTLVAVSVASLAPGVVGAAGFVLFTCAAYARHDVRLALRGMLVRVTVTAPAMLAAFFLCHGTALLVALGFAVAFADTCGAVQLARGMRRGFSVRDLGSAFRNALAASAVAVIPAYVIATVTSRWLPGSGGPQLAMLVAVVVGLVAFLGLQRAWGSAELDALLAALPFRRSAGDGLESEPSLDREVRQ